MIAASLPLLLVCLIFGADARDLSSLKKVIRSPPVITNSIVNLGKIDVAFYVNAQSKDSFIPHSGVHSSLTSSSELYPMSKSILQQLSSQPCPCSSMQSFKKNALQSNPSSLIQKILMSDDLFSFREPTISNECCQSDEDSSLVFDFDIQNSLKGLSTGLPFLKPKQIDIVFLQNKKNQRPNVENVFGNMFANNKIVKKDEAIVRKEDLQMVGDKGAFDKYLKYKRLEPFIVNPKTKKNENKDDAINRVTDADTTVTVGNNANIIKIT